MSPVAAARVLCVRCRRQPSRPPWEPFCSEHCKLQDLARWIDGICRVPGEPVPQQSESDSGLRPDSGRPEPAKGTPDANGDDGDD